MKSASEIFRLFNECAYFGMGRKGMPYFADDFFKEHIQGKIPAADFNVAFKERYPVGKRAEIYGEEHILDNLSDYLLVKGVEQNNIEAYCGCVSEKGKRAMEAIRNPDKALEDVNTQQHKASVSVSRF